MENCKIADLEDLEDILDTLIFEDKPSIFTEEYTLQFIETALHLMDEIMILNPTLIFEPDLYKILLEDITDIFYAQLEEQIDDLYHGDDIEDTINDLLEEACSIFIASFYPDKYTELLQKFSEIDEMIHYTIEFFDNNDNINDNHNNNNNNINNNNDNIQIIEKKINHLRSIPQPLQRTPEWYQFRWNLITASNAWKAFETQSAINQLIYEKCQPIKETENNNNNFEEVKMVNVNTPFHWGQKYEPLSVMIYEDMYNSKVEDFGCIQHSSYKFIGASPDGIVVKSNTGRYGRMLEIKNPVSREITGIPKKEYWVQMQLQMEVCDLDECDFLETKFLEYPNYETYRNDLVSELSYDLSKNEFKSYFTTKNNSYKGTIIYFHTKEGLPYYIYQPLNLYLAEHITSWEEENIEKYQSEPYNYTFIKFIYWKAEKISCILVLRNREWFKNNVGQLEKIWKTIEEERVTGYEHRAPNRKQKTQHSKQYVKNTSEQGCFLFNKIVRLDPLLEKVEQK